MNKNAHNLLAMATVCLTAVSSRALVSSNNLFGSSVSLIHQVSAG